MTIADAIGYLESRFGQREQTGIDPEDIESWVVTALERTKEWAIASGNSADYEREDSLALDGSGTVAVPVDALAGRVAQVRHASSDFNFTEYSNKAELKFHFTKQFGAFAIEDGKIWTRAPLAFGPDPLTGNLLVTVVVSQTLSTLATKYEPYFLDRLVEMAAARKGAPAQA